MKKRLYSVAAAVSAGLLLIAGTFAWTNFDSSIVNNFFGLGAGQGPTERAPGGTLHNDFEEGKDYRDVYVENWGTEPLIVRIQLSEYMEIGEGAGNKNGVENNNAVSIVNGASIDDVNTWTRFNGDMESGTPGSFRYHWNWTMGGNKLYAPAPEHLRGTQDANGVDFVSTTSPVGYFSEVDVPSIFRSTLLSQVISMEEWISRGMPIGNYWVVDADGYSYWAAPLAPGNATGLLLHKVELTNVPEYDYFYAINVAAHMATVDDEPDNYQRLLLDASPEASLLVNQVADRIRNEDGQRGLSEIIHTTNILHDRGLNPILLQSGDEARAFFNENRNWFLQSQNTYDEFLLGLSDNYFSDRAIIVLSVTGSSSTSVNVSVSSDEDTMEVRINSHHPWESLPDFINRFFVVSIDRSLVRENIEVTHSSSTTGPNHFEVIHFWDVTSADVVDTDVEPVIIRSESEARDFYNANRNLFQGTSEAEFLRSINDVLLFERVVILVSEVFCGTEVTNVIDVRLSQGILDVDIYVADIYGPTVLRREFHVIALDSALFSENIRVNRNHYN